ncbi:hypothetical protein M407DRAFT_82737 [Tulasnella calospora MUT 4182]|uniref:Autophagy-related protein 14 n=1 Tax=Tulasnella calospora MUT 4182 TaxID=1051891 RepID=A0A0C3LDG0_9AGAM|nr:hypothetical protein M407DRAFT_82737 [Tulasnella calospora MUT 4182]
MEARCDTCELIQRKFYCADCLRTHIRDFRSSSQRTAAERDAELAKANKTLTAIQSGRLLRADQARLQDTVTEIVRETKNTRDRIAQLKSQIASKRSSLHARQTDLHLAKSHVLSDLTAHKAELASQIKTVRSRLTSTDTSLAATRKVLIKSLVETFDLREASLPPPRSPPPSSSSSSSSSTRPMPGMRRFGMGGGGSSGGDARKPLPAGKGEWSIAGLVLPVAGDLRRHPSEQLTAAVAHTLHFLRLLTFYLGVKLPFEVFWSSGSPGVGQPSIVASRGSEKNGWVNMTTPYPLYLTSSDPPASDTSAPGSPTSSAPSSSPTSSSKDSKPTLDAFTTALCMLNYNIAYLSHAQGLDVPLSVAGETLRNLWAVCCINSDSASHSTPSLQIPLLPPPTESKTFNLEFAQLLQATSPRTASAIAASASRRRKSSTSRTTVKGGLGGGANDEWDLIEIDEGEEGVG